MSSVLQTVGSCEYCGDIAEGRLCEACSHDPRVATDDSGCPVCPECGWATEEFGVLCEWCQDREYPCPGGCGGATDDPLVLCMPCTLERQKARAREIDGPPTGRLPLAHQAVGR